MDQPNGGERDAQAAPPRPVRDSPDPRGGCLGLSSDPPVIQVESLPVASAKATVSATGSGRVSVSANPGWCALAIDGVSRGPTPIAGLELTAGPHQLVCTPQNGKPHSMTVTVLDGTTSKYKFAVE